MVQPLPAVPSDPAQIASDLALAAALEKERAARTHAEEVSALQERLQAIATRLAAADERDDIAAAILEEGTAALGLKNAALFLREGEALVLQRSIGYTPDWNASAARVPLSSGIPAAEAAARDHAIFIASREEYVRAFPKSERAFRPADLPPLAFACLPLSTGAGAMGALVFAWPEAHTFEAGERRFLVMLAHHTAQALLRAQLLERLRSSSETLAAVVRASPAAVILLDLDGTVRMWNPAAARIYGWSEEEALGRFLPAVGEAQRPEFERHLALIAQGQILDGVETTRMRRDGTFDAAIWAGPVRHSDGRVQCLSVVADISARKRLERMQRFVTEAGRLLAGSPQVEETLVHVARLAVPDYADCCFVDLIDKTTGASRRVALACAPAAPPGLLALLQRAAPVEGSDGAALLAAGLRSSTTAQLVARGETIGALTLARLSSAPDLNDAWFAGELARSVSLAVDSARLFGAEHKARLRMTRMQEVTAALSVASTPQQVAEVACRIGSEAMEALSGALWILQPDESLRLAGSWGTPGGFMEQFQRIPPEATDAPAIRVVRDGAPIWIETTADYQRKAPRIAEVSARANRLAAFGAVPLLLRGKPAGVIVFSHALPHRYDAGERAFYLTLSQHCASALDRARLLEAERTSNERLRLLAAVGEALSSSLDLDRTLAEVARRAVPAFADWCIVDRVEGEVVRRVAIVHADPAMVRLGEENARNMPVRLGDGSQLARVIERGEPAFHRLLPRAVIEAAVRSGHLRSGVEKTVSAITVPLRVAGAVEGALTFTTAESGREYGDEDFQFALEVARRVGLAVANANAFAREQRGRARLEALQQVTAELTRARTAAEVARVALEAGGRVLSAEFAFAFQVLDKLRLIGQRGISAEAEEAVREIDLAEPRAVCLAARTGLPSWIESMGDAERFPGERERVRRTVGEVGSYVCLPLRANEAVLGVLCYIFRKPHRFAPEERAFLDTLAENCAQSLERARLLDAARAEAARAEEASRVKDEFLAMLGHELRNPLAPIFTALELMNLRAPDSARPERKVIDRQARHLARLVDDLLDVSRIATGRVRLDREPVEVSEAVARGLELARPLIEEQRHTLATDVARGLEVDGDLTRLSQVVANLLNNAAKYTPPGGHLFVGAAREGGAVVLRVKDDGSGIPAALLPRVFDLFAQGQQSIERARGGLGLGLAIVRSLVELHGGTVEARSDGPGRGSEFVVRLPALEGKPAAAASAAPAPPPAAARRTGRVLVVDDNRDAADLLADALSAAGFTTRVAHDGPSALNAAASFLPEVALLDLGLPVMDGYELARRLRALPGLAALKLVAITGYGQASDRERTRASGFDEHLVKPVELQLVEAAVAALVPA